MKTKKLTRKYYAALVANKQKKANKLFGKLLRKSLKQKKTHKVW